MITKFFNYYFIGIEFCLIIDEESSLKIKLGSSNLGCLFISMDAISKSSSSSCELSDDNSSTCLDPDSTGNAYQASFKSELMFRVDFPNDFDRPKNEETVYGPMPIMKSEEASYNSMETSNNTTPDESVGLVSDFEPTTLLDEIEMEDDPLKIDSEEENNEDSLPTQPGSSKKRTKSKGKQPIEKTFACDYPGCNASFSRPWKLSAHHCRHTGERPFMCSRVGCTKSYTNPTHLRRHDLKVHGAKDDKTDTRRYKCTHPNCWLVDHPGFCTVPGLRKHEQRHEVLDKNGLVCSDCNMTFTRLNELKTHRFEHDNVLPFKCDYCGRAYLYNLELRKHLRMHKRYKCQVAGCESLEFDSFKELQKHKHIHNKQIVCELCGKEFAMKCRLRVHFEEVHSCEPGATQWPCSVPGCPRVFTRRRNMQQHVRQKHQGPGHVCPFQGCHLRFVWKQSLTKHMQLHLMETETETPPVQPEQKEKGPRARRKDADKPKSATAEILSDVIVDSQTKDQLINKEEFDTDEEIIYQLTESPPLSRSSTADLDVS